MVVTALLLIVSRPAASCAAGYAPWVVPAATAAVVGREVTTVAVFARRRRRFFFFPSQCLKLDAPLLLPECRPRHTSRRTLLRPFSFTRAYLTDRN